MSYDIVIVGAGPAGLACARTAAKGGMRTLVIERNEILGKKVCAGGITWNGLIQKIPGFEPENKFYSQSLYSRFQKAEIQDSNPIIATVNRQKLGQYMADLAISAGAEIRTSCTVKAIDNNSVSLFSKNKDTVERIKYNYLVGADGSSSLVRRYIGIPIDFLGVGINHQVNGNLSKMEWHLDSVLFGNGYGWVFPHSDTVSIGAYADAKVMRPALLKKNLTQWADKSGFSIKKSALSAGFINYDYRGWRFSNNIFLAGDAAGLASGLTGEGIYPAIISGNAIARSITAPEDQLTEFSRLIKMHEKHKKMVSITGKNRFLGSVMAELVICALRARILSFNKIEMAH